MTAAILSASGKPLQETRAGFQDRVESECLLQ